MCSAKQKRKLILPSVAHSTSFRAAASGTYREMSAPQQQTAPGRSRDGGSITLCSCSVLLVVGFVLLLAWLSLHPHRPFFTASSISSSQSAFNGSDSSPTRHFGISYEVATTRASFLFYDAAVASGPALAVHGYQPDPNTASIAGVIDVAAEPSFSAALRAGRLPLRLQLTTDISFGSNAFQTTQLDKVERHFAVFTGVEVTVEKKGTVSFREDGSISEGDVDKLRMIKGKSKMWQLLNNSLLKSAHGSYHAGGAMAVPDSSGAAVAQILKKLTVSGALVGDHAYTVRVNPNPGVRPRAHRDPRPYA